MTLQQAQEALTKQQEAAEASKAAPIVNMDVSTAMMNQL
jgi:hypothetical protein